MVNEGQKAAEDVIAQGDHVPTPVSIRTWQFQPCGSGGLKLKIEERSYGIKP